MEDTFEFIKGYENLYKINKNGEVYSCFFHKIMKPQIHKDGYFCVKLMKEKKSHKGRIHRLLALQYIDNPNNYSEVDHIDRNRQNNCLDNLRWVTKKQNQNNRKDNLSNLNEEEFLERKEKLKKYKTEWAKKDRLLKGMKIRSEMTKTKDPNYKANWAKANRAKKVEELSLIV